MSWLNCRKLLRLTAETRVCEFSITLTPSFQNFNLCCESLSATCKSRMDNDILSASACNKVVEQHCVCSCATVECPSHFPPGLVFSARSPSGRYCATISTVSPAPLSAAAACSCVASRRSIPFTCNSQRRQLVWILSITRFDNSKKVTALQEIGRNDGDCQMFHAWYLIFYGPSVLLCRILDRTELV